MTSFLATPPSSNDVAAWCRAHLGAEPVEVLFEAAHLSLVYGLRLADGREVVVKARRPAPRIAAGVEVQRYLFEQGYPAPEPLAGPGMMGEQAVTAERLISGGVELAEDVTASDFAAALQRLVHLASRYPRRLDLGPPLPWIGWEHDEPGLWPRPDDVDADLNANVHAVLDEIGRRARMRLLRDRHPLVLGHGDWWLNNIRWLDGNLQAVFDWDSLAYLSEAAIAGAAAAQFTDRDWGVTDLSASEAFLAGYEEARGRAWSQNEAEVSWAAGLWVIAFNAKKYTPLGRLASLEHLERYGAEKLRRAGA